MRALRRRAKVYEIPDGRFQKAFKDVAESDILEEDVAWEISRRGAVPGSVGAQSRFSDNTRFSHNTRFGQRTRFGCK